MNASPAASGDMEAAIVPDFPFVVDAAGEAEKGEIHGFPLATSN